jgi:ABC-2 type transport system permease protein
MSGPLVLTLMSTWRRIKSITRYKVNFALELLMSFAWGFGLLVFVPLIDPAKLQSAVGSSNYFTFLLIGVAFQAYQSAAIWGSPWEIQGELNTGQIEYTFASPVSRYSYILSYSLSQAIVATVFDLLPMFAIGMLALGRAPTPASLVLMFLAIFLCFLVLCQIGVMLSCALLVFKNISAIMGLMNFLFQVATGMFVPLQFMPNEFKLLAFCIPLTHGIDLARHAIMDTSTIWPVEIEIGALMLFLALFTLIARLVVARVEGKAKREGLSLA